MAKLTPRASFGFHLPYGTSKRTNAIAAKYMLEQYPGWVRNWIARNGGLTNNIKRMGYAYASQYMKMCE